MLQNQFQKAELESQYKNYYQLIIEQDAKDIQKADIDTQLYQCIESAYTIALELMRTKQKSIEQLNLLVQFYLMKEDYITNEKINNPFFFFSEDNFFNNPCLIDQQTLFNHIIENTDYRSEFLKMDRHNTAMAIIVWKGYLLLQSKYPDKKIDIIIQPQLKNFQYLVDQEPYLFSEKYKELYIKQSSINNTTFYCNIFTERLQKGIPMKNISLFEQTNIELGQDILQLQLKTDWKLPQQKQQEIDMSQYPNQIEQKDHEIIIYQYPYEDLDKEYSNIQDGYINIKYQKFDFYYSDCYEEGHKINIKTLFCDKCNTYKDISTIFYDTSFRDYFIIAQQKLMQHISKLYPILLIKPLTLKRYKSGDQIYVNLNYNDYKICSLIYLDVTMNWNGDLSYQNEIEEKSYQYEQDWSYRINK